MENSLSHMRTAPSPLPLTNAYPQNCTAPTKSWYISQVPSAYGGVGTAKLPAAAAAPGKRCAGRAELGFVAGGCDMAQRRSILMTHWPVFRSHCRMVLSDAPVTYKGMVVNDERTKPKK